MSISKRRIPIVIVGLENAGKTTFTTRLKTGKFEKTTTPTRGIDIETAEIPGDEGARYFNLFDLGGHFKFRDMFWKTYVELSNGIIYILDANDVDRLDEAIEWFWKCMDWNKKAPVLILANKIDLEHIDIEKIIDRLDLGKLANQNPSRPYQIYETSIKEGTNLDDAIKWFSKKVLSELSKKRVKLTGLYVYLPTGLLIAAHQFGKKFEELDADLVPGYLVAIDKIASDVMGTQDSLQSINTEHSYILMVKRGGLLCAVATEKDSDPGLTRMIAESFLKHIENNFITEIEKFKVDGKIRLKRNFVIDFLNKEFPDSVIFE
ncbi:MAG: ADP-ribosylation factor-like protein [Candidatus Hodarchaeales archaeon]